VSTDTPLIAAAAHDAQTMREDGADLLSLALMDARNRTLAWLAAFDGLQFNAALADFDPPWWLAGHAGWFQEYWIARHVQRSRGEDCDATGPRLASIEPRADAWFDPKARPRARRWRDAPPDFGHLRAYLADTLESTLELLDKAGDDDDALTFFRLALWHEDRLAEALAVLAQACDLTAERQQGLWPALPSRVRRDALAFAGQRMQLGSARPPSRGGGMVPEAERWAHEVRVAEFEIDAQPVAWSQYSEFVDDGGYDQRQWWSPEGWDWLEASERRAPRYVEQMAGGVLLRRQGRLQRVPGAQSVLHVTWYEADAWCRWAGRRLPGEAEWELAACSAQSRGFAWGDTLEWVAGRAAPHPGFSPGPARLDVLPEGGRWRLLRGASWIGSTRLRHPKARRYADPASDELFCGFRSCAI
jgi:iron(II)-dependent oxidoreductase